MRIGRGRRDVTIPTCTSVVKHATATSKCNAKRQGRNSMPASPSSQRSCNDGSTRISPPRAHGYDQSFKAGVNTMQSQGTIDACANISRPSKRCGFAYCDAAANEAAARLNAPKPGEWLSHFPEAGQSVELYKSRDSRIPTTVNSGSRHGTCGYEA